MMWLAMATKEIKGKLITFEMKKYRAKDAENTLYVRQLIQFKVKYLYYSLRARRRNIANTYIPAKNLKPTQYNYSYSLKLTKV